MLIAETTGEIINELRALNTKIDHRAAETNAKIDMFQVKLDAKIAESRAELIRWVVGVGILQSSLLSALLLKMIPG